MYLWLNNLVWMLLSELSVTDRLNAMKQLNTGANSSILTNKWFVLLGWSSIIMLLILLVAVRKSRLERERISIQSRFDDYACKLDLSNEERSILEAICRCAGVKYKDTIYTSRDVFDRGLRYLMQEIFVVDQGSEEREKLHTLIFSIKEKLSFVKSDSDKGLINHVGKEKSSRQIPVGTVLMVSSSDDTSESWTRAEVIQNDRYEIQLQPEHAVSCKSGIPMKVRYSNAAVTWEFEAITMHYSQDDLVLNHSEQIRYVNRRRFERIKLKRPAKIAPFPVFEQVETNRDWDIIFSPAVITEIAGTGLRIKTDLAVSVFQRVLMMFELCSDRIVRDVAEVRDIREEKDGCSIVVELIGFNTKALNELLTTVNQLALGNTMEVAECQN